MSSGLFLCAGGKLASMKLQFSLATLLVCVTVLAVVAAFAAGIQVHDMTEWQPIANSKHQMFQWTEFDRPPHVAEIARRMLIWGSPTLVATLAVLWSIRRLKSSRENGPPIEQNVDM